MRESRNSRKAKPDNAFLDQIGGRLMAKPRRNDSELSHKPMPGRYARRAIQDARMPPNGVGQRPRSKQVSLARVAVPDPYDPGERLQATVNRRVDILEQERSHGRITEAAYLTGRVVQAVFERAGGRSGGGWREGARVDAATAHELAIIRALDSAHALEAYLRRISRLVGEVGARFLRAVLADGISLGAYATGVGKGGNRGANQVRGHFRIVLEQIAERWDDGKARRG